MSGPVKRLKPIKQRKPFVSPGRYEVRLKRLRDKKKKVEIMESLIEMHENRTNPDVEYIRGLKRRANEVRSQLRVLSTTDLSDRP